MQHLRICFLTWSSRLPCHPAAAAGLCVRVIVTFFIMGNRRYNWKERIFYAVAWTPKATVQASLSAVPLALINRVMVDSPDYEQWQQWGEDCLATGIFAIIVCATLGTLFVFWLAPVLLEKEVSWETSLLCAITFSPACRQGMCCLALA